jgi:hypothetical protein
VLPAWALLIFAPGWKWTQTIATLVMPTALALVYVTLIALSMTRPGPGLEAMGTLAGVKSLFASDLSVLIGWVHYLAFDLLVGSWIARDARRRKIRGFIAGPCLFFTLMVGPFGFLCYLIARLFNGRDIVIAVVPVTEVPAP